jgi:hypothetical protein
MTNYLIGSRAINEFHPVKCKDWDIVGGEPTYFGLDGWYASYEGGSYDEPFAFYEVVKDTKMVEYWKAL